MAAWPSRRLILHQILANNDRTDAGAPRRSQTVIAASTNLLLTVVLDNARYRPRVRQCPCTFFARATLKFAQEFFCGMKDLTGIRRRGPQNAYLTGIICSSRLFKYSAA